MAAPAQSMVTVVVPIDAAHVDDAHALIAETLGNPAGEVARRIAGPDGSEFVHFASLHAVASHKPGRGHLVLELSADGDPHEAVEEFARRAGDALLPIFQIARPALTARELGGFLAAQRVTCGYGLLRPAGLAFSGEPGLSVRRVKDEAALARNVAGLLGEQGVEASALARLERVRAALASDPRWSWTREHPPEPPPHPSGDPGVADLAMALGPAFVATFLWPVLLVALPAAAWLAWPARWSPPLPAIALFILHAAALALVMVGAVLLAAYVGLRRREATDWTSDAAPTLTNSAEMFARENASGFAHNHMMSRTVRKPGLIRFVTLRLAFFAVAKVTALNPKPGFLGDIGTIHFARWVSIPGTRDLLFFSNYGGSWESYLEDFITKAHAGLTGVWSNTIGFPRASNLFLDGATDGDRFKRFARASMRATPFWYSAYPSLTTANIRANALIRRGLHKARTEAEAGEWLSLFGSAPRPPAKLDTTQIQTIVFGGLGFKPEGRLLTIRLDGDVAAARAWLRATTPLLSFNDGRYLKEEAVVSLSLTASGLARLGMPDEAIATFPAAFRLGMRGEGRARILGDDPDASGWWWDKDPVEACLLVYGDTAAAVERLAGRIRASLAGAGRVVDEIAMKRVHDRQVDRKEPFGFVDGVSQPAIRGTYRGLRNADPIHLVEPGEIILGYPDDRGRIAPGPTLDASYDPDMALPIAGDDEGFVRTVKSDPRDLGFNGTFLVVRQLEQDAERFWSYCAEQAAAFADRFPEPAICDAEFIAAKLIGRWPDGSSLVRNPYMSATRLRELYGRGGGPPPMRGKARPADPTATPVEAADRSGGDDDVGTGPVAPDNDYLFGAEDPQGLRCPFGAHVRRANPRDSLSPGSMEQVGITNRHRMLRIGRSFAPRDGRGGGLVFMCLNADIERQFEFVQQTWMGSVKFHGLDAETDAIVVAGTKGSDGFTVPVRTGPVSLAPLPRFVTLRGGGYFFVPGRRLIEFLAGPAAPESIVASSSRRRKERVP